MMLTSSITRSFDYTFFLISQELAVLWFVSNIEPSVRSLEQVDTGRIAALGIVQRLFYFLWSPPIWTSIFLSQKDLSNLSLKYRPNTSIALSTGAPI